MLHASRTHVQEVSCDVWKDDDGGGLSVWRVERNFADLTVVFGSNDEPITQDITMDWRRPKMPRAATEVVECASRVELTSPSLHESARRGTPCA